MTASCIQPNFSRFASSIFDIETTITNIYIEFVDEVGPLKRF